MMSKWVFKLILAVILGMVALGMYVSIIARMS